VTYSLHPGAEDDVAQAIDFYAQRAGLKVAARFLEEFERVAHLLVENPGLGSLAKNGRRTFPLKVFPYCVVYRQRDHGLLILVVRHQRRKPGRAGARR
jgi:plasmid stabilization system protein ParE